MADGRELASLWPEVSPILSRAVEWTEGRYSLRSVLASLISGDMQLWVIRREKVVGAAVTQVAVYDTGVKSVVVMFVAGDGLKDWKHLWSAVEEWASRMGCRYAETICRKGWERLVPGWEKRGIEMVKDIANG